MYYACAMTKRAGRLSKRLIIGGVILVVIAGVAITGYFMYQQYQSRQSSQKKAATDVRKALDAQAYRGDRNLAASYQLAIDDKNYSAALAVYNDAAKVAQTKDEKASLYDQAVRTALRLKEYDQALTFAQARDQINSSYSTQVSIAEVYQAQGNVSQARVYLQKAVDTLAAMPHDSVEYMHILPVYQKQLTDLGTSK